MKYLLWVLPTLTAQSLTAPFYNQGQCPDGFDCQGEIVREPCLTDHTRNQTVTTQIICKGDVGCSTSEVTPTPFSFRPGFSPTNMIFLVDSSDSITQNSYEKTLARIWLMCRQQVEQAKQANPDDYQVFVMLTQFSNNVKIEFAGLLGSSDFDQVTEAAKFEDFMRQTERMYRYEVNTNLYTSTEKLTRLFGSIGEEEFEDLWTEMTTDYFHGHYRLDSNENLRGERSINRTEFDSFNLRSDVVNNLWVFTDQKPNPRDIDDIGGYDGIRQLDTEVHRIFSNYRTIVIDSDDRAFQSGNKNFYQSSQLSFFGNTFVLRSLDDLSDISFQDAISADAGDGEYHCMVKLAVVIQTCALKCLDCHERAKELRSHISNRIKNVLDDYMTNSNKVLVFAKIISVQNGKSIGAENRHWLYQKNQVLSQAEYVSTDWLSSKKSEMRENCERDSGNNLIDALDIAVDSFKDFKKEVSSSVMNRILVLKHDTDKEIEPLNVEYFRVKRFYEKLQENNVVLTAATISEVDLQHRLFSDLLFEESNFRENNPDSTALIHHFKIRESGKNFLSGSHDTFRMLVNHLREQDVCPKTRSNICNEGTTFTCEFPETSVVYDRFRGPCGFAGSNGPIGDEGLKGPKGLTGESGYDGVHNQEPGPRGRQGPPGEQGDMGPRGPKGQRGGKGLVGEDGPVGDHGDAGFDVWAFTRYQVQKLIEEKCACKSSGDTCKSQKCCKTECYCENGTPAEDCGSEDGDSTFNTINPHKCISCNQGFELKSGVCSEVEEIIIPTEEVNPVDIPPTEQIPLVPKIQPNPAEIRSFEGCNDETERFSFIIDPRASPKNLNTMKNTIIEIEHRVYHPDPRKFSDNIYAQIGDQWYWYDDEDDFMGLESSSKNITLANMMGLARTISKWQEMQDRTDNRKKILLIITQHANSWPRELDYGMDEVHVFGTKDVQELNSEGNYFVWDFNWEKHTDSGRNAHDIMRNVCERKVGIELDDGRADYSDNDAYYDQYGF